MALRRITDGFVLEGLPGDKPVAGTFPYAAQAGTEFWPTDGSPPEITGYNGLGEIDWLPLFGGGGGVTVAGTSPIQVAGGPAYVLSYATPGQAAGDVSYFNGAAWVSLPIGNPGDVLTVSGGLPAWAAPAGSVTVAAGDGIVVSGGPAYTVSQGYPGQQRGDIGYFDGTNWTRFPIGTPGQVLMVNLFAGNNELFYRTLTAQEPAIADFTSGVSYDFKFGFAAQAQGDLCFSAGGPGINWLRLPIGNHGDVLTVSGGNPVWAPAASGVPVNWERYVDPAGNDANDGLTPATAVQTVNRAVELAPTNWTGEGKIILAAGAYAETTTWHWILSSGKNTGKVLLFDGPALNELLAPAVATGGSQGAGANFGFITSPVPLVPGAYAGKILEIQTGTNAGRWRIFDNTAADIRIVGSFTTFALAGETFRVVEAAATVTLAAAAPNDLTIISGEAGVCFSGVDINPNGNVFISYIALMMNCGSFVGLLGNGQVICPQLGQLGLASVQLCPTPAIGFSPTCGIVSEVGIGAVDGGRIGLDKSWFKQPVVGTSNSVVFLNDFYCSDNGGVYVAFSSSGQVQNCFAPACAPPYQGVLMADKGSTLDIFFAEINNSPTGGIVSAENSWVRCLGVNGLNNTGYGAFCYNSSRMHVTDANTGSFITGTVGDCQVGSNAAPATWAQIAAGAAADVLDLGAPVPTLSTVTL